MITLRMLANLCNYLIILLLNVRSRNVAVSATIFKTKARELAEKININGFQASDGWLDRWKNRYIISFKTVCGEGNSCTAEMTTPWKETTLSTDDAMEGNNSPMTTPWKEITLSTILSRYKLDEIYYADEFVLFFCVQPNMLLNLQSETCIGGKHSKIRFIGMVTPSATVIKFLYAIKMLDLAWQKVKTSTIINCFAKAGISEDQQKSAYSDEDNDLFKEVQNQREKLNFYPPGTTAEDIVFANKSLISTESLLTDEQFVEEVKNAANEHHDNDEEDNGDDNAINPVCPKISDIREALEVLYDYMPFSFMDDG
ncbi:uncharacterized protein LOC136073819 [Hydra vulgaris]|uniref:uncharacterized protein LOC136073819 n=1 Tax=Hydra vulgaris TaxID=6087 RepID=UPI0032EA19FA